MTVLERLGAHAVRSGLSDPLRQQIRLHLVDTVGAWVAGSVTEEGGALLGFEPADRTSLPGRVALHCALARLSEIDDIHLSSGTTPGAIVIPAALTLAEPLGAGAEAVADAIAVGYDLTTRLGAALNGPAILYRGIWPTYFTAPFSVAAVAAHLLRLDAEQAAHALAIALALASPSVGRQNGARMSRWLAIGNAARGGVAAALAARAGFTGDLGLIEGELFSSVYQVSLDIGALVDGLGRDGAVARTSIKPWCAARQTMAAAQALREIMEEGILPREISSLVVGVPFPYLKMIDHGVVPGERMSYLTSVSYQLALAAFEPNASIDVRQTRDSLPREMEQFMARTSAVPDEDLRRHFPQSWPALLTVETSRGRRERLVLHVPGDPERPLDEFQVAAKFWRLTEPLVGERSAEQVLRLALAALDTEAGPKALLGAIEQAVAALGPPA